MQDQTPHSLPPFQRFIQQFAALIVVILFPIGSTHAADPPGILNHQGRIAVNGVNHDGPGYFKFSLVKDATLDTEAILWHHDGTVPGTAEPSGELNVNVSQGHYSILLGDTDAGMTAIPASVFAENDNVSLRIWFSTTSGSGFEQLAPDRRVTSSGYALSSATAGSLADGALTAAMIADGAVTSTQIQNGTIVAEDFASTVGVWTRNGDDIGHSTGKVSIGGNLDLAPTTGPGEGVLTQNGLTLLHTFGNGNFFAGQSAGNLDMTGGSNTASGFGAVRHNKTGDDNTASGFEALRNNTEGNGNTASGSEALRHNTTGDGNTASGTKALRNNTEGSRNAASGISALRYNTMGNENTASGASALQNNMTGSQNTASGKSALQINTEGTANTASGVAALYSNTTGNENTADGRSALFNNTTGDNNTALGSQAGSNLTTGDDNIMIGNRGVAAESATIRIGDGDHARSFIAGIRGVTTGAGDAVTVMIDSNGQLGTVSSSRRYKQNIRPMQTFGVRERLQQLRPVTFEYKQAQNGDEHPIQFGLIAEEVAEVFPELAVYNDEGQPETVKYHLLTPMLLEEVQKQQGALEEKDAEIGNLKARLESLEKTVGRLVEETLAE